MQRLKYFVGLWLEVREYLCRFVFFFFSSRRRHTRFDCDWSSDVCSSDLAGQHGGHGDVEDRADDQRRDDPDGNVAVGAPRLLSMGGDGVEADVGEEDDRDRKSVV